MGKIVLVKIFLTLYLLGIAYIVLIPTLPSLREEVFPVATSTPIAEVEQPSVGYPVRLLIPVIYVDAAIESKGTTDTGAMDVPKDPNDVSWFNKGPRPGEKGSAVIAGHFGWSNGRAAVFDDLHKLRAGDSIIITDDTERNFSFVVREVRSFNTNENAQEIFYSSSGKHLNLITCEGAWNPVLKSYSDRLVVFADAVE